MLFDGKKLRELRKKAKFTQEHLAELLDCSREHISEVENNKASAINALTIKEIVKWKQVCESRIDETTKKSFLSYVSNFFS